MTKLKAIKLPIVVRSKEDMQRFGHQVASQLRGGDILCLQGELGAGKTTFTQALADALGVVQPVTSPTFGLVQSYDAKDGLTLYHFDWYRLEDAASIAALGVAEILGHAGTICVIEWPERAAELLPSQAVWLHFSYVDANTRRISDHP